MEGEKQRQQERKSKQVSAQNKSDSQQQKLNEASVNQIMQQTQNPLDVAKKILDLVNQAEIPEYLVHAIIHGNNDIAQYLIQKGVSNQEPPSILQSSWLKGMPNHNEDLLKNYKKTPYVVLASSYGQIQIIKKLLLHSKNLNEVGVAGIYNSNYIITNVLGAAAFNNQTQVVKFLTEQFEASSINIEYKATEEQVPSNAPFTKLLTGCTPLLLALHNKCDLQLIESLINAGADVKAKDLNDNSVLHVAIINNNLEYADLLITKLNPINERNNKGETAEQIARSMNNSSIIKLFQSKGNVRQQMADPLLQQEEANEYQKVQKKNKNKENQQNQESQQAEVNEDVVTTEPSKKQIKSNEEFQQQKTQSQQFHQQQSRNPKQAQYQKKQQAQPAQQEQQVQQTQAQEEDIINTLEQPQFQQEDITEKNLSVVGINPQILKKGKEKKQAQKQEPSQNILQLGMKLGPQNQQNSSQQKQTQQKGQNKWESGLAGFTENDEDQFNEKTTSSQDQSQSKVEITQRLETEIQDLQRRIQSMGKRMLFIEKELDKEKKKRQEYENYVQNQMGQRNQQQDKKELLEMCNEQLKAKSQEIAKLKSMLSGN